MSEPLPASLSLCYLRRDSSWCGTGGLLTGSGSRAATKLYASLQDAAGLYAGLQDAGRLRNLSLGATVVTSLASATFATCHDFEVYKR
jgi:hypothetical protein